MIVYIICSTTEQNYYGDDKDIVAVRFDKVSAEELCERLNSSAGYHTHYEIRMFDEDGEIY